MAKGAAFKNDATVTFETFDSYPGVYPEHLPLITAAGMLLPEADNISRLYRGQHSFFLQQIVFGRLRSCLTREQCVWLRGGPVEVDLVSQCQGGAPCCHGEVLTTRSVYDLPGGIDDCPFAVGINPVADG